MAFVYVRNRRIFYSFFIFDTHLIYYLKPVMPGKFWKNILSFDINSYHTNNVKAKHSVYS